LVIEEEREMKQISIALVLAAAVLAGPSFAYAQATPSSSKPAPAAPAKKPAAPAASAAVHATKGVVKSVDASTLVVSKTAGKGPETTFVVNASTKKEGNVAVGSSVDVRYRMEGKDRVATAITAKEAKAPVAKAPVKK
jgi:hypothetical protein